MAKNDKSDNCNSIFDRVRQSSVDEIAAWATTPERVDFIHRLAEFFTPTEIVLIVRAVSISYHGAA